MRQSYTVSASKQAATLNMHESAGSHDAREIGVARVDDIAPGTSKSFRVAGREICVINSGGRFYALRNACPHRGAPLCAGTVGGTLLASRPYEYVYGHEGSVIRCPWHGYEFDLESGNAVVRATGLRVKTYPVRTSDGSILVCVERSGSDLSREGHR